jgi:hypothetical protein
MLFQNGEALVLLNTPPSGEVKLQVDKSSMEPIVTERLDKAVYTFKVPGTSIQ